MVEGIGDIMVERLKQIPFHRPMQLSDDDKAAAMREVINCLTSGNITNGENVRKLEDSIADYYGTTYAIATSSATQGLMIALQALYRVFSISRDAVVTPAFGWCSTVYAIESAGKTCAFMDIDPETWTMKQSDYYINHITMPVHTFGNVCEINSKYTIYDGAHSLGSHIGHIGDATVISLAPTKMITSMEGGVILTENPNLAACMKAIRDKVSRMSEVHSIYGNLYLNHLDDVLKFKKKVFDYYSKHLDGTFQRTDRDSNHNTIGMLTDLKIPDTVETRKYYKPLGESRVGLLDNTEEVYRRIVCLPSYHNCPYERVVELINEFNEGL